MGHLIGKSCDHDKSVNVDVLWGILGDYFLRPVNTQSDYTDYTVIIEQ